VHQGAPAQGSGSFTAGTTYNLEIRDLTTNAWEYIESTQAPPCSPGGGAPVSGCFMTSIPTQAAHHRTRVAISPIVQGSSRSDVYNYTVNSGTSAHWSYYPAGRDVHVVIITEAEEYHPAEAPHSYSPKRYDSQHHEILTPAVPAKWGPEWQQDGGSDTNYPCYRAECYIDYAQGPGPDGIVLAGQQFTAHVTIVNTGDNPLPASYPPTGWPLGLGGTEGEHPYGDAIPAYATVSQDVTLTAPDHAQLYGVGLALGYMSGGFDISTQCGRQVNVYEPFDITGLDAWARSRFPPHI
jgi:hypothetical protein